MLLHPVQNKSGFTTAWIQRRPYVTQRFGMTNYAKSGAYGYLQGEAKPHTGIDFRVSFMEPIFSPMDGEIRFIDSGDTGYGKHVKIRNSSKELECVLAHLETFYLKNRSRVSTGDIIGYAGSTGMSTGVHLHFGIRKIYDNGGGVFNWPIQNYDKLYYGYIDPLKYLITWKGTQVENSL